jgi:hypothetical protein
MRCSVVFFLSALNRDITCAQELRELALQELALQELVLQALALVLALLLLSLQALPVSFLVRTDSQPTRTKMLLTSAPKA